MSEPNDQISPEELRSCISVLEKIIEDRALLVSMTEEERKALLIAAGRVSRPTRLDDIRLNKAFRRQKKQRDKAHDRAVRAATQIRSARRAEVFEAPKMLPEEARSAAEPLELAQPKACYVCKSEFRKLHFFYDCMCPPCAELNYEKRFQTASLEGRVALITGARIKIGFQAALKLLRAGARVIVTTRFPHDAAQRFSRESDFAEWKQRLEVHGLDLRHLPSVEFFTRYLDSSSDRLDFLINNAAQTVRRPAGFYAHLLEFESRRYQDLPRELQEVLASHEACKALLEGAASSGLTHDSPEPAGLMAFRGNSPGVGIRSSAALSQLPCTYDNNIDAAEAFPAGRVDADLQQVDMRMMNSWRLTLADVPSHEMLEVQLVNAAAPFILASKLKPLMMRDYTGDKHIVNVSAMEGQFARRTKTDKHPHTNMAKAALNMMTLTAAPDYAAHGIFMNAVDTGWVTDEDPLVHATRKAKDHDFQPPLDIVDGAARILDPIFSGILTGIHLSGQFLKDYRPTSW